MTTNTIPANPTRTDDVSAVLAANQHLTYRSEEFGLIRMSDASGGVLTTSERIDRNAFVLSTDGPGGVALDPEQAALLANLLVSFVNGARS